jgi:hypothetical protein
VLIAADLLQVLREQLSKDLSFGCSVVLTRLLPFPQCRFHLLCRFRKHVELVQLGNSGVDHVLTRGPIDCPLHVGCREARRNGAEAESGNLRPILHFDLPDRCSWACPLFHAEVNAQTITLVDTKQFEAAGLIPEGQSCIHRLSGLVLVEISLNSRAIAAIECIEPRLQCLPCGRIWDSGNLGPDACCAEKECSQELEEHIA